MFMAGLPPWPTTASALVAELIFASHLVAAVSKPSWQRVAHARQRGQRIHGHSGLDYYTSLVESRKRPVCTALPKILFAYTSKMELHTARLHLRELSISDLSMVHHLHSLPEVDEFNTLGIPNTLKTTQRYLTDWLAQGKATPRVAYVLAVQRATDQKVVGLIALNLGKATFKNAEVWYKLLPEYWSQGLTTEALTALIKFGFDHLHLHRIEAGCAVENSASIRVLEKVGMTREGRKRQILPIRGNWVDNYFFAILDSDIASK